MKDSCNREIFSADRLLSVRATPAIRPQGSLARELARAAGARLRELPSAAAQQDKATNLAVRESRPSAAAQQDKATNLAVRESCLRPQHNKTKKQILQCEKVAPPPQHNKTKKHPHSAKPQTIQSIPTQTKHPTHTNIYYLLCIISYLLSKIYQDSGLQ